MAIRGTLTHRKTRRLAKLMNIAQPFALGLMEALWHVTAEQAPTGAIGRLSNKDIADEMFWDEDPDVLIQAFIDAGLIDKHPQFRLIIHDWQSHADQATKRKLARHGKTFADGDDECLVMTSQGEAMTGLPVPVPVPVPETRNQRVRTNRLILSLRPPNGLLLQPTKRLPSTPKKSTCLAKRPRSISSITIQTAGRSERTR